MGRVPTRGCSEAPPPLTNPVASWELAPQEGGALSPSPDALLQQECVLDPQQLIRLDVPETELAHRGVACKAHSQAVSKRAAMRIAPFYYLRSQRWVENCT